MSSAPVIETPRLILRPHRTADFTDSLAMWSDPAVTRYIGGRGLSAEEVWVRLLRYAGGWALLGYGFWVVQDRVTGAFMGEVGFHDLRRDTKPSFAGTPEMGWALAPQFHRMGFAREAVDAALRWSDTYIENDMIVCIVEPANVASIGIAEAAGFFQHVEVTYKQSAMQLFKRHRPQGPVSTRDAAYLP
jgi:RimJ/RimL family protein N-acetyltransferase